MKRDKRSELAEKLGKMAKEILEGKGEDINYPGRSTGHIRRASDIVGNDLLVQKAIAKYYGLKE